MKSDKLMWGEFVLLALRSGQSVKLFALIVIAITLVACAGRRAASPLAHHDFAAAGFVDLQPGWRLRVVTPITKSGTFNVVSSSASTDAGGLSMKTSDDFIGYEVSYYSVESHPGGGISIRFASATDNTHGKTTRAAYSRVQLFELPPQERFARLLFLTRVSPADHDQGIVAAPTLEQLKAVTARVQADPEHNCTPDPQAYCTWVPIGIAVQPEQKGEHGKWVPAT